MELAHDPASPLLGIHTEETRTERGMCTPMFMAALFTIARAWKQLRCPSEDKWMRKPWYIYTMEYYSAIKKNRFESVLIMWMKLKPIIWREVSQKEKHQYSIESESEASQSCPTLCNPMDCSLPGSSILGIFQARVLEWVASAFSGAHRYCCIISPMRGSGFAKTLNSLGKVQYL